VNNYFPCAIWGTPATGDGNLTHDGFHVDSPRTGGEYFVSGSAWELLKLEETVTERHRTRLTTWLVDQRRLGNKCPKITIAIIDEVKTQKELRVIDRTDRILKHLENINLHVGSNIVYKEFHTLFDEVIPEIPEIIYLNLLAHSESISSDELRFLMNYLDQRSYIRFIPQNYHFATCILTIEGYERLESSIVVPSESTKAFVAMWFHESTDSAWLEGIRPGVKAAGYEPIRVDQEEYIDRIDDRIVLGIRESRFIVADFTQRKNDARGGVYYEAGFAHGLGIPVIFTCRSNSLKHLHFDIRQYNHIVWKTPEELREKLTNRIRVVIGKGPGNGE